MSDTSDGGNFQPKELFLTQTVDQYKTYNFAYKDEINAMDLFLFRLWGWLPETGSAYARTEWPYVKRARVMYAIGLMHAQLHDFMTANYVIT